MKAVLRDIADQFQHCTALMSDPPTLRSQSERVANQFVTTARRIDRLKAYLQRPKDLSGEKLWLDKTILEGVDHLVDRTLKRHLMPLYDSYKFPVIFDKDRELYMKGNVQEEGKGAENLVIREVKETNCMGAVVLLYYSLHWHLILIKINRKENPSSFYSELDDGSDESLGVMGFPNFNNLLEDRIFPKTLSGLPEAEFKSLVGSSLLDDRMIDPLVMQTVSANIQRRVSSAVRVFKKVLSEIFHHKIKAGSAEFDPLLKKDCYLDCMAAECIVSSMETFGGVISTFNLQDDIDVWGDMYKLFEVQSDSDDPNARQGVVYEYRLIDILTKPPYHHDGSSQKFAMKASKCAIHDFGSVGLMVDVSRSLVGLGKIMASLEAEANSTGKLITNLLCLQSGVCNRALEQTLTAYISGTAKARLGRDKSRFHKNKYIFLTSSWKRPVCTIDAELKLGDDHKGAFMIDNLAGLYWGCRPSGFSDVNHKYLAVPQLEIDPVVGLKIVHALQCLCEDNVDLSLSKFVVKYVVDLHRNSLFVLNESRSLILLIEYLKRIGSNARLDSMPPQRPERKLADFYKNYIEQFRFWYAQNPPKEYTNTISETGSQAPDSAGGSDALSSFLQLKKNIALEMNALQLRMDQARSVNFQKYPGISWPIRFGTGGIHNNFGSFDEIRSTPYITKTIRESADAVASLTDHWFKPDHLEDRKQRQELMALLKKLEADGQQTARLISERQQPAAQESPASTGMSPPADK